MAGMFGDRSKVVIRNGQPVQEQQPQQDQPVVAQERQNFADIMESLARQDAATISAIRESLGITQSRTTPFGARPATSAPETSLRPQARPEAPTESVRPQARPEPVQPIDVPQPMTTAPSALNFGILDQAPAAPASSEAAPVGSETPVAQTPPEAAPDVAPAQTDTQRPAAPLAVDPNTLGMIGGVRDENNVWQSLDGKGQAHDATYKDYSQLFREYTFEKKDGYIPVGEQNGATVYAAPDYAKDDNGNYISVNKNEAAAMAEEMGGIVPTRDMVKSLYSQAIRIPMPTQPIGSEGGEGDSVLYTQKINEAIQSRGVETGSVIAHGKEFFTDAQPSQTVEGIVSESQGVYKVKGGDTLYAIARSEGVTLEKIIQANPGIDPDKIVSGQDIKIPTGSEVAELPDDIKQQIGQSEPKTKKELTQAIFDATKFSGNISTPKPGDDPLTWIAQNTYGLDEKDPNFRKAFKAISGIDPKNIPWCAAFANHVLKNMGVDLPSRAKENPLLAYNYVELGKEVYNHNPTTGKTYAGTLADVKPGDIVVFNNSARDSKGNIQYGQGHISFVVGTDKDGSIIAMGGNQGGGRFVTTTKYTPDIIRRYYKGGFTVRRIDSGALEQTDPAIIAAITKDISMGGAER